MENKIYVTKPFMPPMDEYVSYLKRIWDSKILTNNGMLLTEFKEALEKLFDTNLCLFTNGHMALELGISAFDFKKGSEVITTPFTFISTTHSIINNGLNPVFCDIKIEDYTIDETKIESLITENTVAILAVHVYGFPCNVEAIQKIANKHNLRVIYDSAHAFFIDINGKSILSFGDLSMVSFHSTKLFHTIEGGMVASNNDELIKKLHIMKNFGITGPETVEMLGVNAKMSEFQAAMGLSNLKYIEENIKRRKEITNRYKAILKDVKGIKLVSLSNTVNYNYAYLPILINETEYGITRDELSDLLEQNNVYSRKYFSPCVNEFECYKDLYKAGLSNSLYVSKRILTLPIYYELKDGEVDVICDIIKKRKGESN